MRSNAAILALLALGALLLAAPADAVLVETPLRLHAEPTQTEVGKQVNFTVDPWDDAQARNWSGQAVRVEYSADRSSEADGTDVVRGVIEEALLLDAKAHAAFAWVVPEAADDANVFVALLRGNDTLGSAHLAVGNATPIMFAAGGGPGEPVPPDPPKDDSPVQGDGGESRPPADEPGNKTSQGQARSPAPGIAALALGAVGAALLLALGRRRD